MMSQLHPKMLLSMNNFALYIKRSTIFTSIIISGSLIGLIGYLTDTFGLIGLSALLLVGADMGLFLFQYLQFARLSRAKRATLDPHLTQSCKLLVGALFAFGISIVWRGWFPNLKSVMWMVSAVLTILSYRAIVEFIEGHFSLPLKVRQGFQRYSISTLINVVLYFVSLKVSGDEPLMIVIGIISIVSIVTIVGQLTMANGFLEVFRDDTSYNVPFSSRNDSSESTNQSFVTHTTDSQSSDSNADLPSPPPTSSESQQKKFCTMCGSPLLPEANFCGNCGSTQ